MKSANIVAKTYYQLIKPDINSPISVDYINHKIQIVNLGYV